MLKSKKAMDYPLRIQEYHLFSEDMLRNDSEEVAYEKLTSLGWSSFSSSPSPRPNSHSLVDFLSAAALPSSSTAGPAAH